MVCALTRHSECVVDCDAWPQWEESLTRLNASGQFRPLCHFPIDNSTRWRLVRESLASSEHTPDARAPEHVRELRVAVIGNVDAGKSTMLGVLSRGSLDDGRGAARVFCARHRHESESGRTSSVSQELLGYRIDGSHITHITHDNHTDTTKGSSAHNIHHKASWEANIGHHAWKIASLIDLAGHERFLRTTMFGLTGFCPDIAMLMVGANTGGLIGTSKEHLALAAALALPVVVVITKIDLAPDHMRAATLAHLHRVLRSPTCRKTPLMIRSLDDVIHVVVSGLFAANQLCPVLEVSNVTGQGVSLLRVLLNLLPPPDSIRERWAAARNIPFEYQINETYSVAGVGTVVSGVVLAGDVRVGDPLLLGPADSAGRFLATTVRGIQRKRIDLRHAVAGQAVSLALRRIKRSDIRYGMALVSPASVDPSLVIGHRRSATSSGSVHATVPSVPPSPSRSSVCREFTAQVVILFHSTTITPRYQAMLHCGTIRQTVQIVSIQPDDAASEQVSRTGDRVRVRFRFLKHPEILHVGMKLLFRENRTRGLGKIIELHN